MTRTGPGVAMLGSLLALAASGCGARAPAAPTPPAGHRAPVVAPSSPAPTVSWRADETDDYFPGRFEVHGLPAVARDGSVVVLADQGEDGARGAPNMVLRVRDRDDHALLDLPVFDPDADAPGPSDDVMAEVKERLVELHARYDLRALDLVEVPRWGEDGDVARAVTVGEVALRWGMSDEPAPAPMTISVAGAAPRPVGNPAWFAGHARPWGDPPTDTCENSAFLSGVAVAPTPRLALIRVSFTGTDMCWEPDSEWHVMTW
ncbi:MAG: hypothetical protein R2939_13950 [Kofleriaceae bacterium]